jgi:hypothetical protein
MHRIYVYVFVYMCIYMHRIYVCVFGFWPTLGTWHLGTRSVSSFEVNEESRQEAGKILLMLTLADSGPRTATLKK